MLKTIKRISQDFKSYSHYSGSGFKAIIKLHFYCNVIFRISNFLYSIKLVPIARIFWLINRVVFSIDIDPRANLAGGFVIIHGIGIVIGRYVTTTGPIRIYQGATLGGNNGKIRDFENIILHQPYIMSDVTIGINSAVLGPVVIKDNAVIGTLAVVTKDVEESEIIVGHNKSIGKNPKN